MQGPVSTLFNQISESQATPRFGAGSSGVALPSRTR